MFAIIGMCALVIGLTAGFALGRRSARDADVRRELRSIRATARRGGEHRALYPYPHHAVNPADVTIAPF